MCIFLLYRSLLSCLPAIYQTGYLVLFVDCTLATLSRHKFELHPEQGDNVKLSVFGIFLLPACVLYYAANVVS